MGYLLLVFCLTAEGTEEVGLSWKFDIQVVDDSDRSFLQLLFLCFSVFTFILVFPQGLTGTDGPRGPNGPPGDRVSTTLHPQCLEMELCHCLHWWFLLPLWIGDTGELMMAGYLSVNPCRMLRPLKRRPKWFFCRCKAWDPSFFHMILNELWIVLVQIPVQNISCGILSIQKSNP